MLVLNFANMDNPFTAYITKKAVTSYFFEDDSNIAYRFAAIGFGNMNIISGQADQYPIIIFMTFFFVLALLILRLFCLKGKRGFAWLLKKFSKTMKWNFFIRFGIELMLMGFINVNLHIFYLATFNNYKDITSYILALLIALYLGIIYVMSFILLMAY